MLRVGHLLSILAMIRSAMAMASAMAYSSAGEGSPSQLASALRGLELQDAYREEGGKELCVLLLLGRLRLQRTGSGTTL